VCHYFYDICSINGLNSFDPIESTFYDMESTNKNETNILVEKIKPYPRKWENFTMGQIKEFTLTTGPIGPHCLIHHKAQALVFSVGGYTETPSMTSMIFSLFITVNSLFPNQDFILVISKLQDWWVQKYKDLLQSFSKYPIINIDKEINVTHCFPRSLILAQSHGFMNIDPKLTPNSKTLIDFHNFLATTYDDAYVSFSFSSSFLSARSSQLQHQSQLQYQSQSRAPNLSPSFNISSNTQSHSQPDQSQPQPQHSVSASAPARAGKSGGSVGRLILNQDEVKISRRTDWF
ncbi:hypothetical protein HAX54_033338, partial [Datura stramonium]|nr:hypothetical protein [Datura stramonium]